MGRESKKIFRNLFIEITMKISTAFLGFAGALLWVISMFTHDWWAFAIGVSAQVLALLWAIYEKLEEFIN